MHCNRWGCSPSLCINYGHFLCIKNWFLMGAQHKPQTIYHLEFLTYSTSSLPSVSCLFLFCSNKAPFSTVECSSRGLYSGQIFWVKHAIPLYMDIKHLGEKISARNNCSESFRWNEVDCEALNMDLWTVIKLDLLQDFCIGFSAKVISRWANYLIDRRLINNYNWLII